MDLLETEDSHRFLESGSKIEQRLKEIYLQNLGCESEYPWERFILSPELEEAIDLFEESIGVKSAKVFILQGPPGCGKTKVSQAFIVEKVWI